MARVATDAHAQTCRICGLWKPTREFSRGSSYCRSCDAMRQRVGPKAGGAEQARLALALAEQDNRRLTALNRKAAIEKHAVALDFAIFALWQDGGFGAVHLGLQEAVKRLCRKKRAEIAAEGWIV